MARTPSKPQLHLLITLIQRGDSYALEFARAETVRVCTARGWVGRRPTATPYEVGLHYVTDDGHVAAAVAAPVVYSQAVEIAEARGARRRMTVALPDMCGAPPHALAQIGDLSPTRATGVAVRLASISPAKGDTPTMRLKAIDLARLRELAVHKDWKMERGPDGEKIVRQFHYRNGAKAALWVEYSETCLRGVSAHVSVPLSGGPEESIRGVTVDEVISWVDQKQRLLSVPLFMEKAATVKQAMQIAKRIDRIAGARGWYTLGYVFDLDCERDYLPGDLPVNLLIRKVCDSVVAALWGYVWVTRDGDREVMTAPSQQNRASVENAVADLAEAWSPEFTITGHMCGEDAPFLTVKGHGTATTCEQAQRMAKR